MKNSTALLIKLIALILIFVMICGLAAGFIFNFDGGYREFLFNFDSSESSRGDISGTHDFSGIKNINVNATSYSVTVEEHDSDKVVVEEYLSGTSSGHKKNEIYKEGETLYFKQSKRIISFGFNMDRGTIVIKVPKASSLEYKIKSVSGAVDVDAKSSKLDVDLVSGSIEIFQGGDTAQANSVSGSIKIYEPFKEIEADSTSGSVKVTADKKTTDMKLNSISGSVRIKLAEQVGYTMEYSTVSGSIKDYYNGSSFGKKGTATQGDRSIEIDASTVSGSIKLEDWQ